MSTPGAATAPQQINVADLELPQLAEVKKQLEEELSHLTNSFAQLKQAQTKFRSCIESAKEVKPENKDKTILVPLTGSLYVPGKLRDVENVVIDVGTGYYVREYRDRKWDGIAKEKSKMKCRCSEKQDQMCES
ncbi:Prefoldin [Lactarius vividus]|nr:Prefoldin [Lactarius vividus]